MLDFVVDVTKQHLKLNVNNTTNNRVFSGFFNVLSPLYMFYKMPHVWRTNFTFFIGFVQNGEL